MEAKSKKVDALAVRMCGVFAVTFAVAVIGLLVFGQPKLHGINSVPTVLGVAGGILIIGIGTFLLRRWAAVLLSLLSLFLAFAMVLAIVEEHLGPFELFLNLAIDFVFFSLLLIPAISTVRSWKKLR